MVNWTRARTAIVSCVRQAAVCNLTFSTHQHKPPRHRRRPLERKELRHLERHGAFEDVARTDVPAFGKDEEDVAEGRVNDVQANVGDELLRRPVVLHESAGEELRRKGILETPAEEVGVERLAVEADAVVLGEKAEAEVVVGTPEYAGPDRTPRAAEETAPREVQPARKRTA